MEKLLKAIASELKIRDTLGKNLEKSLGHLINFRWIKSEKREVTEEVRQLFVNELNNHICSKFREIKIGDNVEYVFDYENIIKNQDFTGKANDNLSEVFKKLPVLKMGEIYVLPEDTYINFILIDKDKKYFRAKVNEFAPWIRESRKKYN